MGLREVVDNLRGELNALEREFKVDIPKKIEEARSLGDLTENAEYHAIKERQGFVQARITSLKQRIASLSAIDPRSVPQDRVGFWDSARLCTFSTATVEKTGWSSLSHPKRAMEKRDGFQSPRPSAGAWSVGSRGKKSVSRPLEV
jgi:hypothetical protein